MNRQTILFIISRDVQKYIIYTVQNMHLILWENILFFNNHYWEWWHSNLEVLIHEKKQTHQYKISSLKGSSKHMYDTATLNRSAIQHE